MEFIKNILKGMVVGIANIIPGVSGGTLMVSMNIYDKLIHSITHFFRDFKHAFLFLLAVFIGIGIAVVGGAFGIEALFAKFPAQANLLFIGLILGGLPAIFNKVKGGKTKPGHILGFALFFLVVLGLSLVGNAAGKEATLTLTPLGLVILFAVGIISAATMVIPGVSGSMILLVLGYYNPIISEISSFFRALKAKDLAGIIWGFEILVPFGLGVIVGIIVIAKLIERILTKYPKYAFWSIMGLIVASPFAIVIMNLAVFKAMTAVSLVTGVVALFIGIVIAMKLGE